MISRKNGNKKFTIIGVGEILWDVLPGGKKLGGAPTNFTYHASALGTDAYIVSSVGKDNLGNEIIDRVNELGLSSQFIQSDRKHLTGTVDVTLDHKGIPSYIIHENVAWDYIKDTEECLELARKADAICFGSLGQRSQTSRNTILKILQSSNSSGSNNCLKVFDINLRQHFYNKEIIQTSMEYANVLKFNDEEFPVVIKLLGLDNYIRLDNIIKTHNIDAVDENSNFYIDILTNLTKMYSLNLIAVTHGSKGSLLFSKGQISSHPGFQVEVVDTVGAGDAFTAAVVTGLQNGLNLDEINDLANKLASYVCSREGGTPNLPDELAGSFK
jgi:fructokinase